jgi:hypothetical protein
MQSAQLKISAPLKTTTSKKEAHTEKLSENKNLPVPRFDKFPEFCDACGIPLMHEDLIGKYSGIVFEVRGYKCPGCGHKVGKLFSKNFRDSTVRFDWTRLGLPKSGKVSNMYRGSE